MYVSRRAFIGSLLAATALSTAEARGRPAVRRPNIITIVLDDVGYSDLGCFGSEIRTPAIDGLAARGLRYAHFDTKAVCASTRAAMLTGRNSHTVNMPDVPDVAQVMRDDPAMASLFHVPRTAETVAQVLKRQGYATWAIGKWHLIPMAELGEGTGRDSWPLQRGFDLFYGFPRGWTDQYRPEIVEANAYVKRDFPDGYHLSADLADRAIDLIDRHGGVGAAPFYLNLAFGTAHAPLQVPRAYSARYDALYARGWDTIRDERFARMKQSGLVPSDTILPPRPDGDRAWAALSEDERVVFARMMAVYAGFIEHCDEQIGRVLAALKARGLEEDTLVILISDNGAAAEAGQDGEFDGLYRPNTLAPATERARIDELGTVKTQFAYPRPWAMAGTTPLRRYKLWPYSGGTRTPLIVRWPREITDRGAIRRQYVDVVDIAPTILAAAGTAFDPVVDGVRQLPVAGRSFDATFRSARAPGRSTQYFELRGNRAITHDGWRAVAMHRCGAPYAEDRWELFHLDTDFSEATDLAARHPERLAQLKRVWDGEWARYGTGPLRQPISFTCGPRDLFDRSGPSPSSTNRPAPAGRNQG